LTCCITSWASVTLNRVLRSFALAGDPEAWIARIEEIANAGATRLWLNAEGGNLDRQLHYMRLLGERIMSRFV
jgi:hypothetical protein